MAYRSVDEGFWSSHQVGKLSAPAKLLYLYFITYGGTAGLYQELPEVIRARTGLTSEGFDAALNELKGLQRVLQAPGKGLFWVVGQIEHQILKRGILDKNKAIGIQNQMTLVSFEDEIYQAFNEKYGRIVEEAAGKPLPSPLQAPCKPPPISKVKESKVKETKDIPAQKEKAGREALPSPKPRSPNQRIQDGELEAARKEFAKKFGGPNGKGKITEAQLSRLAFGAGGNGRDCFETLPALTAFLASLKDKDCLEIEEPYAYLVQCARNPETVERAKKQVFAGPETKRGGGIVTIGQILEQGR